ncbi:hypothetical protein, partial [Arthrobacter sp. DR-2P]
AGLRRAEAGISGQKRFATPALVRRLARRQTVAHGNGRRRPQDFPGTPGRHGAAELGPARLVRQDPDGPDLGTGSPHRQDRRTRGPGRNGAGNLLLDPASRTLSPTGAGAAGPDRREAAGGTAPGFLPAGGRGTRQPPARGGPV